MFLVARGYQCKGARQGAKGRAWFEFDSVCEQAVLDWPGSSEERYHSARAFLIELSKGGA